MRGNGTTNGSGQAVFTIPNLPSPASLSSKIARLEYAIYVGGDSYDHNYNGALVRINNGVTVPAGLLVARGRLTGLDSPTFK